MLILGAAGGVGVAAVQICKVLGAKVVAVARGESKAKLLRELGADAVIDTSAKHQVRCSRNPEAMSCCRVSNVLVQSPAAVPSLLQHLVVHNEQLLGHCTRLFAPSRCNSATQCDALWLDMTI